MDIAYAVYDIKNFTCYTFPTIVSSFDFAFCQDDFRQLIQCVANSPKVETFISTKLQYCDDKKKFRIAQDKEGVLLEQLAPYLTNFTFIAQHKCKMRGSKEIKHVHIYSVQHRSHLDWKKFTRQSSVRSSDVESSVAWN